MQQWVYKVVYNKYMQSPTVCFWPVVPLGFGGGRLGSRLLGGRGSCRTLTALPLLFSILLGCLAGLPARSGLRKQYIYYVLWSCGSGSVRRIPMFLYLPDPDLLLFVLIRILPSSSKISKKSLDFYCFATSLWLFIFGDWWKCTFKSTVISNTVPICDRFTTQQL